MEVIAAPQLPAIRNRLYRQLRVLARARLRNGGRNTLLDTSALVHEAYLRMAPTAAMIEGEPQFLAYASHTMRSVIVDLARRRNAQRRGGQAFRVTWTESAQPESLAVAADEIVQVHEAVGELEKLDPRLAQVVEMRYFGGLTDEQIAQALGIGERTVRRDWDKARLLLEQALRA